MTLICNNNCKIKGPEEDIRKLYDDLVDSNFSMNAIIPLNDINDEFESAEKWGTGSIIELESSIFSLEDPTELIIAFKTNGPIEQFFRYVSSKYKVQIDYAFYSDILEYVGVHYFDKGILKNYKYEEDPKSINYKTLVLENNFTLPEGATATIISFEDLMKRGNKK